MHLCHKLEVQDTSRLPQQALRQHGPGEPSQRILVGQVSWAGSDTTTIDNRLSAHVDSDGRITARSDECYAMLTNRPESLERDRDRLPKLEERFGRIEKMPTMIEWLRETRQERAPKR